MLRNINSLQKGMPKEKPSPLPPPPPSLHVRWLAAADAAALCYGSQLYHPVVVGLKNVGQSDAGESAGRYIA